jgi:dienelactone hydrolase
MRRSALFAVAVLSVAHIAAGQPASATAKPPSALLGNLELGPHAVGFRVLDRIDRSRPYRMPRRPDGSPRAGDHGRPMHISLWYPAEARPAPRVSFGDYTALIGGETVPGAPTPTQIRQGEDFLFQFPVLRDLSPEQRKQLLALRGIAVRDARPLTRRFPLVIWSLGSPALTHASCEYLASHGYVVAQMPRLGVFAGLPDTGRDAADFDAKLRDMDFVLNAVQELPFVDAGRLAVVGFSAGGRWALGEAMKHPSVAAVVSLDTVMLFDDDGTRAWRTLPSFDLSHVRVPVLHMIRKEWVPREDKKLWEGLRHADRWYMRFDAPSLDHLDFQSIGYATTLVGGRAPHKTVVSDAFHAFNRYTLAFFDAHVKGDVAARARFDRPPQAQGLPAGFVDVAFTAAEPGPMKLADFLGVLDENGVEAAVETYRAEWKRRGVPPVAEPGLNHAAYGLLFSRPQPDAAIQLFELNIEAFPQSANAHDSLADAYQIKGDAARARTLAEKALALLEADATMTKERKELIRQNAQRKLAPAPPPAN